MKPNNSSHKSDSFLFKKERGKMIVAIMNPINENAEVFDILEKGRILKICHKTNCTILKVKWNNKN